MIITPEKLLPTIKNYLPNNPIIIEAGAFTGNGTRKLANFWPEGTIHAFEPVPEIFQQLQKNTQDLSNVYSYTYALDSRTGFSSFNCALNPKKPIKLCSAGSILTPKERLEWSSIIYNKSIQVPTITLNEWGKQYQVKSVDFIWLDTQGHELAILKHAQPLLDSVKALFIEVNFIEAYQEQPSYACIDVWLQNQGFIALGTDFKDQTSWFFGNVLYIRKNPAQ